MKTVERLLRERDASTLDPTLGRRCKEVLLEGLATALALEGQRRRIRRRQQELACLSQGDDASARELARLARREVALASDERRLRDLLARLRDPGDGRSAPRPAHR